MYISNIVYSFKLLPDTSSDTDRIMKMQAVPQEEEDEKEQEEVQEQEEEEDDDEGF